MRMPPLVLTQLYIYRTSAMLVFRYSLRFVSVSTSQEVLGVCIAFAYSFSVLDLCILKLMKNVRVMYNN